MVIMFGVFISHAGHPGSSVNVPLVFRKVGYASGVSPRCPAIAAVFFTGRATYYHGCLITHVKVP